MRISRRDIHTVEMQMGPMIDVVFLLLVFFMVTAKPIKPESDVGMTLPGSASQDEQIDIPDEQQVIVGSDGSIGLNDMQVAASGDREMPQLLRILNRFREASARNKSKALVTIAADDAATHQRIVDVLNVCAQAGITGVTFADSSNGGAGEE